MTPAPLQRKCACGSSAVESECEECKQKSLQRKATASPSGFAAPRAAYDAVQSGGHPLDHPTRAVMESRFGYDFSRVRVHTGAHAARAARTVNAEAYTIGSHVVFGAGRYAPATRRGEKLLVHELTHVVQQQNGTRSGGDAEAEREALHNESRLDSPEALSFRSPAPLIARKPDESTTTMQAPTAAPGCTAQQHTKIYPAAQLAIQWLDRSLERLNAFISAPADQSNHATADALERHFHSTQPAIARRVLERIQVIRHDIDSARVGDELKAECHTNDDQTCQHANAYVPGDLNKFVFCPIFFGWSLESRAESIVHEMAHTIVGDITDRGYRNDRVLSLPSAAGGLSSTEALTNAESFGLLVQELGTGRVPPMHPARDSVADSCRSIEPLVRAAMARAQRWNRVGETDVSHAPGAMIRQHLGSDTHQIRNAAYEFYHGVNLRQSLNFVCDKSCGNRLAFGQTEADNLASGIGIGALAGVGAGLLAGGIAGAFLGAVGASLGLGALIGFGVGIIAGAIIGAVTSHPARIHICPGWKDQDESHRIESILAAAYQALGRSEDDSVKYARLAGAISERSYSPPGMDEIDQDWLETRLSRVRAQLAKLRAEYRRSSDAFAASTAERRQRESVARGTRGRSAPPGNTPDRGNLDPDDELERVQGERESELARIRARRARIDESVQSVNLAEEIIRLEAEERDLSARLNALP